MPVAVGIFAHQEERRIGLCLASLPLDRPDTIFHVLVNGTTDTTVDRAQQAAANRPNVIVHDIAQGGKSRTWNRFVHQILSGEDDAVICMDGDAQIMPGSIDALFAMLAQDPARNAIAGLPANGRHMAAYREGLKREGGLFGDLYALQGRFVRAVRTQELRLPDDLIGDDGLVAAWAHNDLGRDDDFLLARVATCDEAEFVAEQVDLLHPATWRMQYKRMINYSVRFYQSRIVADIMTREGPQGLPPMLATLYPQWLPRFRPRGPLMAWFDYKALERMRAAARY
jgi:glycosyltransferase involved in cell wall biosynthesis